MNTGSAAKTAERARTNCEYVRDLILRKHGPARITILYTAAEILAGYRYERCPACGEWRQRAIIITSAGPRTGQERSWDS